MSRVDVWTFELDSLAGSEAAMTALLQAAERERAGRPEAQRRAQFVLTRGVLRLLLARRLDVAPSEIAIVDDDLGKPQLVGAARQEVHFNVSHTCGLGAVAIADRPVGVDVEIVRPRRHLDGIAARILTDEERREFDALNDADRVERFYALWTAREALAKGLGTGLAFVLERGNEVRDWTVVPLPLPDAYRGAVAAPGDWQLITHTLRAEQLDALLP